MRLMMKEKKKLISVTADRYKKSDKAEKRKILDELIELTGYNRSYASLLLRLHGKAMKPTPGLTVVGDALKKGGFAARGRKPQYTGQVITVLRTIWVMLGYICGKRLAPALAPVITMLEKHGEIKLDRTTRTKLSKISPATIDRLLKADRKKAELKGRSGTKPGSLLKHQIAVKTFSQWDDTKPGFLQVDLVGHDGGNTSGDFCQSLDATDVSTCWTETAAVKNKAQVWVFKALNGIVEQMPFDVLGINSDNGSEFINNHLIKYCQERRITFTRGRPYRKNDNCYVEQKNYTMVRCQVGYARYDTPRQLDLLNEYYFNLRLLSNFFVPAMKMDRKTRIKSKILKHYDRARTPYQRVLDSPDVSESRKQQLRKQYKHLNPAQLRRQMNRILGELERSITRPLPGTRLQKRGSTKTAKKSSTVAAARIRKIAPHT